MVKLIFQFKPLKLGTLVDFVHDSKCKKLMKSTLNCPFFMLESAFEVYEQLFPMVLFPMVRKTSTCGVCKLTSLHTPHVLVLRVSTTSVVHH